MPRQSITYNQPPIIHSQTMVPKHDKNNEPRRSSLYIEDLNKSMNQDKEQIFSDRDVTQLRARLHKHKNAFKEEKKKNETQQEEIDRLLKLNKDQQEELEKLRNTDL